MSATAHAAQMDAIYAGQRHIYDATRKYYLLGRDRLIADLAPPPGGRVVEVGCGTGRNLILAARRDGCGRARHGMLGPRIRLGVLSTSGRTA